MRSWRWLCCSSGSRSCSTTPCAAGGSISPRIASTPPRPAPTGSSASIKEPINLYFFYSEKTAQQLPQLKTYGTRVREFLEELTARSNGKLHLHVIDPQPFSEEEDRAAELGVRGAPVGVAGGQFYFGLAGTNATDGHAAIEFFDPNKEQFLEYDVVKLIYQLANPKKPVVGLAVHAADGRGLRPPERCRARAVGGVRGGQAAL